MPLLRQGRGEGVVNEGSKFMESRIASVKKQDEEGTPVAKSFRIAGDIGPTRNLKPCVSTDCLNSTICWWILNGA